MTAALKTLDLQGICITPLRGKDCLFHFTCGEADIDRWAKSKAHKLHEKRRARVWCARLNANSSAIGFFSLSLTTETNAKIDFAHRDAWKNGAPLIFVDFIGVSRVHQAKGLGKLLLMDALFKSYQVASLVAPYGVALRSLNERTTKFYRSFGFALAPDERPEKSPLMILPIWSIVQLVEGAS